MDPTIITFVSACTALVASILGPTVTLRAARTQFNANVLSGNRQKWIDAFRDLVASFLSQLFAASLVRGKLLESRTVALSDPAMLARVEQIVLTISKIRLMINPNEADHQRLFDLISQALDLIRTAPPDQEIEKEVQAAIDGIAIVCQGLLKREWVRVKQGR